MVKKKKKAMGKKEFDLSSKKSVSNISIMFILIIEITISTV